MFALLFAAIMLILIGVGLDNHIQMTNYNVTNSRIPSTFEGFKIAQISDLHCLWFGEGQSQLVEAVKVGTPNIIVLTGDIIDAFVQDYDSVAALFDGLTKIAPVYAVSGNHERNSKLILNKMDALYNKYGVNFLKDKRTTIGKDGAEIYIYGMDDQVKLTETIPTVNADTYGILLFHRSNLFDDLTELGYGPVFSGHLHGGLIRIPFAE